MRVWYVLNDNIPNRSVQKSNFTHQTMVNRTKAVLMITINTQYKAKGIALSPVPSRSVLAAQVTTFFAKCVQNICETIANIKLSAHCIVGFPSHKIYALDKTLHYRKDASHKAYFAPYFRHTLKYLKIRKVPFLLTLTL